MTRCLRSAEMLKILQQKGGKKIDEASATKILKIIKFIYMREHHSILFDIFNHKRNFNFSLAI